MVRARLAAYRRRVRRELERSFDEELSSQEIAISFAVGAFITALPTLGTGLLLFVVIVYLFERISKLALLASVVVLNPVAKWGVYVASYWIGTRLLGPVPGVALADVSFEAGPEIVVRLLVGNFILAVVFSIVGYVLVLRLVREYRRRDLELTDLLQRTPE